MSETLRFWLDWSVQLLVAIGTLGAVFAALGGDWIKARFVKLRLTIENSAGVLTPTIRRYLDAGNLYASRGEARYYHLRVSNASSHYPAHQVFVWLLAVDEFAPGGDLRRKWSGEIPLVWQHMDKVPGPRSIGDAMNADVFTVDSEKVLALQPLIQALNLPSPYNGACRLILTVQARSNEAHSPISRAQVSWDGEWSSDDEEMRRHLTFEILADDE